ncbi:MAG: hypothetical protein AB1641_06930 [Thermodesulfobacteriota bacterium]
MIYELTGGRKIDTDRELNFEERNFLQKMMIYKYLKISLEDFQKRWRSPGNPVWKGAETPHNPGPAAMILLDMESRIENDQGV